MPPFLLILIQIVYTYNLYCVPVLYIRIHSGKLGGEYKLKFKIVHGKKLAGKFMNKCIGTEFHTCNNH